MCSGRAWLSEVQMPRQGMGRHGEVAAKDLAEMGFCEK